MLAKQLKTRSTKTEEQKGGEQKNKKGDFFETLLAPLRAVLLPNLLTSKGAIRAGEGAVRAGQHF